MFRIFIPLRSERRETHPTKMIKITYSKANFEALSKNLKEMNDSIKQKLSQIIEMSMLDVQTTSKQPGYVPVKSGTLKRSITHKTVANDLQVIGYIGTNLVYARIQEFGGSTGKNGTGRIQGKFYMTRAIEVNKGKIKSRFKNMLIVNNKI